MISRDVIKSGADYAKYLTEQQAAIEYYADEVVPSQWHGNSADIAGLSGKVEGADLANVLAGNVRQYDREAGAWGVAELGRIRIDKETGEQITQHRAGYDFTFSPDKSFSVAAGIWGSEAALDAHNQAVAAVMRFVESELAQARISIDGIRQEVKTGNLLYATFQHATSREADAQIHTHCVLANVTHYQGKAYSLDSTAIFKFTRTALDQMYNAELARASVERGIEIVRDENGVTKIAQYADVNLDGFSKRAAQIDAELEKHGLTTETASAEAKQAAKMATRKDKNHIESAEAHRERWQEEAKTLGVPEFKAPAQGVGKAFTQADQKAEAHRLVNEAKAHLTSKEQVFEMKDLLAQASRFSDGKAGIDAIREAVNDQMKSGDISMQADGGKGGFGKGKITTREAIQDNETLKNHVQNARGAVKAVMTKAEFEKCIATFEVMKSKPGQAAFRYTQEQRAAAEKILTTNDRAVMIDGKAGTGKTTLYELVNFGAKSKGYKVTGISSGGAQANKLQSETGIESHTQERWLRKEEKALRDRDLAKGALETYEKGGSQRKFNAIRKDLKRHLESGAVSREYDAAGRTYLRNNKSGEVFCTALHKDPSRREVESRNVNHLGLTKTKYVVTKDAVFKQGGTLVSELAGKITDKLRKNGQTSATSRIAVRILSKFENWQKAGVIESQVVRARAALEAAGDKRDILKALKAQANPKETKELVLWDEGSMTGVKDANRTMAILEKKGIQAAVAGDPTQLQGVSAGPTLNEMAKAGIDTAKLENITRQVTDQAKDQVATILNTQTSEQRKGGPQRADPIQQAGRERYGDAIKSNYIEINTHQKALKPNVGKTALKNAREKDNGLVVARIAKDFVADSQQMIKDPRSGKERIQQVIAITTTNRDRNAINAAIRDEYKAAGLLKDGHNVMAVRSIDRTEPEQAKARFYQHGELLQFGNASKRDNVKAGDMGKVTDVDDKKNQLTITFDDGSKRIINPAENTGLQSFREAGHLEFSEGDRITFTKNNSVLDVKNGQMATVEKFDGKTMSVRMTGDEKQTRTFDIKDYRFIDHGYAVTTMKSQGETVDKALIHHNTETGGHGDRTTYVSITRVRFEAKVYTQDIDKAAVQAGLEKNKTTATPLKEQQAQGDEGMADKLQKADHQTVGMQVIEIQDPRRTGNATKDAQADQALIRQHIARDYADNENRDKTQIVAGTREDRQQLNNAVRETLKERGMIARDGVTVQALEKIDRGRSGLSNVANYNKGEAVRFGVDMPGLGLKKGEFATVAGTKDGRLVTVKITDEKGKSRTASFDPQKARSVEVFNKRQIDVATGDKLLLGNKLVTVDATSGKSLVVKDEAGKAMTLDTKKPLEISHGYAVKADQVGASTTQIKLHIDKAKAADAGKALAAGAGRQTQLYTASIEKATDKLGIKVTPEQQSQRSQDKAPEQDQKRQKTAIQIHRETRARRARTQVIERSR